MIYNKNGIGRLPNRITKNEVKNEVIILDYDSQDFSMLSSYKEAAAVGAANGETPSESDRKPLNCN